MFILSSFQDLVIIDPAEFKKRTVDALEDQINTKYANKVLSILLATLLQLNDTTKQKTVFWLVVFVPVVYNVGLCICLYDIIKVAEGLVGHGSGSAHVNVEFRLIVFRPFKATDFFDEIFIPNDSLFENTTYDVKENVWIWNNDGNEFYMDKNEVIRFRVEDECFEDQLPVPPHLQADRKENERRPPYRIIASAQQAGMGLLSWWAEEEEGDEG